MLISEKGFSAIFIVLPVIILIGIIGGFVMFGQASKNSSSTSQNTSTAFQVSSKTETTTELTNYDNPNPGVDKGVNQGIKLSYPKNWDIKEVTAQNGVFTLRIYPSEATGLSIIWFPKAEESMEDYIGRNKTLAADHVTNFKVVEEKDLNLGSIPAKEFVFSGVKDGQKLNSTKWMEVLALTEKNGMFISFRANTDEEFDKLFPQVENVVKSINFK